MCVIENYSNFLFFLSFFFFFFVLSCSVYLVEMLLTVMEKAWGEQDEGQQKESSLLSMLTLRCL